MPEPLNTTLLSVLVAEVARSGITALLDHARSPRASTVDLATGEQSTTLVTVKFSVVNFSRPYWLLFGLQSAEGPPDMIPVIFGEPIKLRVPRARYDLSALFMTKPASFDDKPDLVAVGSGHEVLASAKLQRVTVHGRPPTRIQIERLMAKTPVGQLPFRLPGIKAILPPSAATEAIRPRQSKRVLGSTFDHPEPEQVPQSSGGMLRRLAIEPRPEPEQVPQSSGGMLRRLAIEPRPGAEPEPEPEVKLVRQERVRQSRSKRSGKR